MELREKIVAKIEDSKDGADTVDGIDSDWLASKILAIPEIAEALEYRAELGPVNQQLRDLMKDMPPNA